VFVLEPLAPEHIRTVVERGAKESGKGGLTLSEQAINALVDYAQGDARRALNAVEAIASEAEHGASAAPAVTPLSRDFVASLLEVPVPKYDKSGEEHYNLISALHKAVRGSDPDAALYWLARMLAGGEDPLYLARRIVRMSIEDIGLADPRAVTIANAAKEVYHFLGSPEGELALAQAVVYLATAPKSNRIYAAFGEAQNAARQHPSEPVPLHLRSAPTPLMKGLGYGEGYQYAHDHAEAYIPQEYLPEPLRGAHWYTPSAFGYEKTVQERMEWWERIKREASGGRDR